MDFGADASVHFMPEVGSTNDVAIDAARAGAKHGWAISAGRQTSGRGRRGHAWASPSGSLYLSVVLRPGVPMQNLIALPALSAMGVVDALRELGLEGRVGIKWPNDIVARADARNGSFDRKLVGILVEARSSAEGPFAVSGMGINVQPVQVEKHVSADAMSPQALGPISLKELLGTDADVPELASLAEVLRDAVVARVDAWAEAVRGGAAAAGPLAPILAEYFDMVPMLGHQVAVLSPTGQAMNTGVFAGLDMWGRACVMTPSGEQVYPSEAVSLREL